MGERVREIKFRAWDKTEKEMFKDVDVLRNGSVIWFEIDEYGDSPIHWYNNYGENYEPEFANTMVVMQYTGLKDKNGEEIFEGDIVQFVVNSFGSNGIERNLNKGAVYYNEDMTLSVDGWMLSRVKSREVIGNIYENPELLENEHE